MDLFSFFRRNTKSGVEPSRLSEAETEAFLQKNVRHSLPSWLLSLDDEPYQPNERLIQLGLQAANRAFELNLSSLSKRFHPDLQRFVNTYPGEHYRLLTALMEILKPALAIEIGTYQGAGCLAMKAGLPQNSRLITYDIIPFAEIENSGLNPVDFDGRMEQRLVDLSRPLEAEAEMDLLSQADFIFVDAAKDGQMERDFIALFDRIPFHKPPVVMFDDIRFVSMIPIWRSIAHPKLDMTSFGHWSGTGLVEWTRT
jgi:predicted O-methyltransferase YrrM